MLRKILSWPWAQATLWLMGIFAMLVGAGGDYGPNWGAIVVGAVFVAAAIALGFLRLQRQRFERRSNMAAGANQKTEDDPTTARPTQRQEVDPSPSTRSHYNEQVQRIGRPWWHGLVTVLAMVVGVAGARVAINYFQSPEQEIARMSDAELVERLEQEVIQNSDFAATFVRMKQDFPAEYTGLMESMVQLVRENASEDEAYIAGREFMGDFFLQRRATMRRGSEESLAEFLDSQVRLLIAVGTSDPETCASIIDTGRFEPRSGMALLSTTSEALNAANIAMFDAIRTGQAQPVEHLRLTDAEWSALFDRAETLGADMTVLSAMGGAEFSQIAPERRCRAVTILYQAMNETDRSQRARFAAELMGS